MLMGGWGLGGLIEGWRAGCVSVEDFGDVGFGMGEMNILLRWLAWVQEEFWLSFGW